jgi:anaerobic magnesium-protoporphyrin IX monomethyl ester cyclase
MFLDDELNVNRGMVELMNKIADTGIDWRLRGFVKAELFTDEQAEAMYRAGFRILLCGFESAHPKILRNINKKATREDNTRMLRTAHRHGLKVKALMSFGHPGESEETIQTTKEWLLAEKPDDFDCTVITVYPGTNYYDKATPLDPPVYVYETHGDKLYSEDVDFTKEMAYYKGKSGEYHAYVWTDYLSRQRLAELRDEVEAEVREKLSIPWPSSAAAILYEHSMGQALPPSILRSAQIPSQVQVP